MGEYSPATKISVFNYDVKLVNPKFTLTSDTLRYSTATKLLISLARLILSVMLTIFIQNWVL